MDRIASTTLNMAGEVGYLITCSVDSVLPMICYRNLLLGGYKGHLATVDWQSKKLGCEFHVYETVRDVQ